MMQGKLRYERLLSTIASRSKNIANQTFDFLQPSIARRCIFSLILIAILHVTYIIWKIIILENETLNEFVDIFFIKREIFICIIFIIFYLIGMLIIWRLRNNQKLQNWIEFVCLQVIAVTMAYQGYIFGSVSIVTGMLLMCISAIGLVLFSRRALYSAVFTGVLLLTVTAYAYSYGLLPYAPKFMYTDMFKSTDFAFFLINNNFLFSAPIFFGVLFALDLLKTELKKREALFIKLVQLDPLTKIYNRYMIYEYMKNQKKPLAHISESQKDAIILLDMDFFKLINDQYGHQMGDQVLIQTASHLRQNIREHDILARFGGEEFIIILPDTSISVAYAVAERCREALAALTIPINEEFLRFTASFGVTLSAEREHLDRQINIADQALYQAKRQGRNCTVIYPPELRLQVKL